MSQVYVFSNSNQEVRILFATTVYNIMNIYIARKKELSNKKVYQES